MTIREMLIALSDAVNASLDSKIVGFLFTILMVYVAFSTIRSIWKALDIISINQHAERDDINNFINKEIEKNGKR